MADLLDGAAIADELKARARTEAATLAARGSTPALATVLVGDDYGARMYRRQIDRTAAEIGVVHRDVTLPATAELGEVLEAIRGLGRDDAIHGILPLRPLPAAIAEAPVLEVLDPAKDIDGLHPVNAGRLALGEPAPYPATPWACFVLLDRYFARAGSDPKSAFEGKDVVIVGRSNIVGKPAYFMALQRNATPTTVHSFTWRAGTLPAHTRRADILIVAMGKAQFIKGDMVKAGAIVIDVGINAVPAVDAAGQPLIDERGRPKRRTVGDVAFDEVKMVAAAITPVPGGVGSLTGVLLMQNVLRAASRMPEDRRTLGS
jgi:methylenetetrahydrofolate dehydrogenase (NADP+)/methenyltetrahydrofolate cyclohydrolase